MRKLQIKFQSYTESYYSELFSLFVFSIYLLTLGRSIGELDSGELALCQATLSIPHPTGYPLFSLLGFLFIQIPIPIPTIVKLNLLNSIWCTLTVFILMKISSLIFNNLHLLLNQKLLEQFSESNPKWLKLIVPSVFGGLMFAFSATFWLQSTKVEVYSLQIFISSLIIYNTLKVYLKYEVGSMSFNSSSKSILKEWWIIALLIGLGFSNHMMTVYLLPATIFMFFILNKVNKKSLYTFFILLLISLTISTLFYIGLMFRAQTSPPWAYGNPSNFSKLIEHVTAKEYSKYMFQNSEDFYKQGAKLFKMLSFSFSDDRLSFGEFGLSLFLGIAGIGLLLFYKRNFFVYIYLVAIVSIITALSYSIPDINEYFLVAYFIISLSAAILVNFLISICNHNKSVKFILLFMTFVFIAVQILVNYRYADRSEFYVIEDFLMYTLKALPRNSVLLSDNWESVISPALYYQNYEKLRNDISIISPSGLLSFDWYKKKQHIQIFDSNFVVIPRENLFVTFDVGYNIIGKKILRLPPHYSLIPMENFYMIGVDTAYYPIINTSNYIRFSKFIISPSEEYIRVLIPTILEQRIYYELTFNKVENAKKIFNQIENLYPEHTYSEITLSSMYKNKVIN